MTRRPSGVMLSETMETQTDLFDTPADEPEDGCFSVRRYATCDLCKVKEAPGNLHHAHGVPVLFMCDDCDAPKETE